MADSICKLCFTAGLYMAVYYSYNTTAEVRLCCILQKQDNMKPHDKTTCQLRLANLKHTCISAEHALQVDAHKQGHNHAQSEFDLSR